MTDTTVPHLVSKLKKRSGLTDDQIVERMSAYLQRDYSKTNFERKFRGQNTKGPYSVEEMRALIQAFTDMVEYPCQIEEAFLLFRLAQMSVDDYWWLKLFFAEEDYNHAVNLYLIPEDSDTAFLSPAIHVFIQALISHTSSQVREKLDSELIRSVIKLAFVSVIERYAGGKQSEVANVLTRPDGLLSLPDVAAELAQVLQFKREPNTHLIGQYWRSLSDASLARHNFTYEAEVLVNLLRGTFRAAPIFRPVFEAKTLKALVTSKTSPQNSNDADDTPLGQLYQRFNQSPPGIQNHIRSFDRLIKDKTTDFVGRQFIFDAIQQFIINNPRGYYIIRGEPGIGKTALIAQWIKQTGFIHHFNMRADGFNKASDFLRNVSAQLIAVYNLPYEVLPRDAGQDGTFFNKVLDEVSQKLAGNKCIIVVDALDEVETIGASSNANILYLPPILPEGIFIVTTTRAISFNLRIDIEQQTLYIEELGSGNIADIREYIGEHVHKQGIETYMKAQRLDQNGFVELMAEKSEGNFMYLHYVLPEIERGLYIDMELTAIPQGLQSYYNVQWQRMKGRDQEIWFEYKLPVLVALTAAKEAVSVDLIRDFLKIDRKWIRTVIDEWEQFLNLERVPYDEDFQLRYRLYHASFFDFISSMQEVKEERVDLKAMHGQIADVLWNDLFDNQVS